MSRIYSSYRIFGGVVFVAIVLSATPVGAQWRDCGAIVSSAAGHQTDPQAVPGGDGGAIIAWTDARGDDQDIYIQRIDALGQPLWTADGVLLCGSTGDQSLQGIVPDGRGGVIVVWTDNRVYAQRLDSDGNTLWMENGVPVCLTSNYQSNPTVVSDGAGGAFIAWADTRQDDYGDIYAQHLDSLGNGLGFPCGYPVSAIPNEEQSFPKLVSDGGAGAFVVWRGMGVGSYRLYAQRLDWWCNPLWAWPNGVSVTTAGDPWFYDAVSDDAGGMIVGYIYSYCTGGVYAQRLDGSGNLMWTSTGAPLHTGTLTWFPVMVKDGEGGAIVVWEHDPGVFTDVEAQAVDAAGNIRWPAEGVMLCDAAYEQRQMTIACDGARGAFVAWQDARGSTGYDVFAQHVDSAGTCLWDEDGTAVCSAEDYGQTYPSLVSDDQGGAIVVWEDRRDPAGVDLYANRMRIGTGTGKGGAPPSNRLSQNYPNPFNPITTISFELAEAGPVSLRVYDITGRLIRTLVDDHRAAGPHSVDWDAKDNKHQPVASGIYMYRLSTSAFSQTKKMVLLR